MVHVYSHLMLKSQKIFESWLINFTIESEILTCKLIHSSFFLPGSKVNTLFQISQWMSALSGPIPVILVTFTSNKNTWEMNCFSCWVWKESLPKNLIPTCTFKRSTLFKFSYFLKLTCIPWLLENSSVSMPFICYKTVIIFPYL